MGRPSLHLTHLCRAGIGNDRSAFAEADTPVTLSGTQSVITMLVAVSRALTFRLTRIPFANNLRFFISQWLPVDDKTMTVCMAWIKLIKSAD